MTTVTPALIDDSIRALCSRLVPDGVPIYVSVHPEHDAEIEDCFVNVARKVNREGGTILHGWQIWDWVGVLVEAEFHAIWVSPDGANVDLTPKKDGEQRILFLSDPARRWTGQYIDNVRQPLVVTQLFKDLEAVSKRLVLEYNRGERVSEGVALDPKVVIPLQELKQAIGHLLNTGGNVESLCPCGSSRKYKNCHRKILYP